MVALFLEFFLAKNAYKFNSNYTDEEFKTFLSILKQYIFGLLIVQNIIVLKHTVKFHVIFFQCLILLGPILAYIHRRKVAQQLNPIP